MNPVELDELTLRVRVLADEADAELTAFAQRVSLAGAQADTARQAMAAFTGAAAALGAQTLSAAAGAKQHAAQLDAQARQMNQSAKAAASLRASVADVEKQAKALQTDMKNGLGMPQANQRAYDLLKTLYRLEGAAQVNGRVDVNTREAHRGLTDVIRQSDAATAGLERLRAAAGKRAPRGGLIDGLSMELRELDHLIRTGCASTADEVAALSSMLERYQGASLEQRYLLEERLYEARERLRKENLQRDLDIIAHKKAMNEISLEQEIEMLERVRVAHRMTAEEIRSLDEQIYQARQDILARDAGAIDRVNDGLTAALQNRYQAWKARELARLDESREAWERWADESAAAIQRQIDALDALSTAESREAQDEKELRQIEKLRQEIAYERDAYNRAMLAQSLEQAVTAREERLRRQETDDRKQALRQQQTDVAARLQAETDALQAQRDAVESAYAERMQSHNLAAEAERLLLKQNQQELLTLLAGYAPAYNALGKTLGERLAAGLATSLGNLTAWFESLSQSVFAAQQSQATQALAAADAFAAARGDPSEAAGSVVVNQTNTFAVPVESPSDTARRVAQANEDLGLALLGVTPYAL